MTIPRQLRRVIWLIGLMLAGCAQEWGPEPMSTTRVAGEIGVDGRPLTGGWIEFLPVDGTVGNLRVAPIGKDGRYQAERVAVGRVAVALTAESGPPIPRDFRGVPLADFRFHTTPIRKSIPSGKVHRLDIDLGSEAREARRP